MKHKIFVIFLCLVALFLLSGQSDFEKWQQEQSQMFRQYKSEQDKAFGEFLEQNWKAFEMFKGEVFDDTPKPVDAPVLTERPPQPIPAAEKVKAIPLPQIEEAVEKHSLLIAADKTLPTIKFTFWGLPLEFNYQLDTEISLQPLNEKAVADFWYIASNSDYELLLNQIRESREKIRLNDWGYCLLLNEVARSIVGGDQNLTRLYVWFLLTKTGYECKVGYGEGNVYLLIPSDNKIYGVSFVEMDGKRYYALMFEKQEKLNFAINTYEGKYPDVNSLIDLSVTESPRLDKTIVEKELVFRYQNDEYRFVVQYNQNAAKFFKNYPQTDLDIYFQTPLSPEAAHSLTAGLKPIVEGKSVTEAANIILRFVQTAFQYKTDDEQFGREKSFFADEILFHPYCDCEDRSIFYSYLVKNILGLDVVGLDYPGHIATAVNFQTRIPGDLIVVGETEYAVCDPTYINADIGMAMPQFKNVQPQIIQLP
jgi:hypothetical protein